MKKLALHWQILLGMVFGVLFAFILIQFTWGKDVIVDWVKPFGTIFINLLKLKNDEIAVSFYTNGGLGYHLHIDNFIFNQDGDVKHNREEIYYKNGKKHKKRRIFVSDLQKESLKKIIHSDFFFDFVKYTQNDFKYSDISFCTCII